MVGYFFGSLHLGGGWLCMWERRREEGLAPASFLPTAGKLAPSGTAACLRMRALHVCKAVKPARRPTDLWPAGAGGGGTRRRRAVRRAQEARAAWHALQPAQAQGEGVLLGSINWPCLLEALPWQHWAGPRAAVGLLMRTQSRGWPANYLAGREWRSQPAQTILARAHFNTDWACSRSVHTLDM